MRKFCYEWVKLTVRSISDDYSLEPDQEDDLLKDYRAIYQHIPPAKADRLFACVRTLMFACLTARAFVFCQLLVSCLLIAHVLARLFGCLLDCMIACVCAGVGA